MELEQLRRALTEIFRRRERQLLSRNELILGLCFDLGACSMDQAKLEIQRAQESGILIQEPGGYRLSPAPARSRLDELFEIAISRIQAKLDLPKEQILEQIRQKQQQKLIYPIVAALWIAKQHGVTISDLIDPVLEELTKLK